MKTEGKVTTIKYVCSKCGEEELIPIDVIEYFDEINPEQLLYGEHQFRCEKCATGIMVPKDKPKTIIKGYGLFEGYEK